MSDEILISKLEFILESISLVEVWLKDISEPQDFLNTSLGQSHYDATLMRFQAIGESLKKIEQVKPELLRTHPEADWYEIIRLREIISHHYEKLSHEIIFDACKYDLPILKKAVESIIHELKKHE